MQIIFQQLSVGFARVGGEKDTALLLSYSGILAQTRGLRAFVFYLIFSDTQQIVHKFYIIHVRHCLGWGGGVCAKTESLQEKNQIISLFFLVWAVKHKLVSMRFRNIIKRRKSCQKRVNNTYIIVRVRTKATELVIFVVAHIRL